MISSALRQGGTYCLSSGHSGGTWYNKVFRILLLIFHCMVLIRSSFGKMVSDDSWSYSSGYTQDKASTLVFSEPV